ncbi:hypothetical protein AL073_12625 [Loktanella sp. 1ANDIMAR09]|nr:hypothetical protein AL073_12625 [Loktanella sp. 1ANDIMAR09]
MFAPEGFAHWFEIREDLEMLTWDAFQINLLRQHRERGEDYRRKLYYMIMEHAWYGFLDESPSVCLCSHEGGLVRFSGFEVGLRVNELTMSGVSCREFLFIDDATGQIELSSVDKRIRDAEDLLAIHSAEEATEDNPPTLTEDEFADLSSVISSKRYLTSISKYDGWAVCCREEHRPMKVLENFVEEYQDLKPKFEKAPAQIDYAQFLEAQRTNMPLAEISRGIIALCDNGSRLTRSEYKEAICPRVSERQFLSAWKRATEERPQLSSPGRRKSGNT